MGARRNHPISPSNGLRSPRARPAVTAVALSMQQAYRDCLGARGYTREKKMDPPPPGFYRGIDDEGRSASR